MSKVVAEKDFDHPIIRKKSLSAVNGGTMATRINLAEYGNIVFDEPKAHGGTDLGPSPLQGVLGALCACESVTFNRTAEEMGLAYDGISFDAAFTIDIRGRQGARGVVPHFQTIKVEATVRTSAEVSLLEKVVEETEARCPVYNLVKDAGIRIQMVWIAKPAS